MSAAVQTSLDLIMCRRPFGGPLVASSCLPCERGACLCHANSSGAPVAVCICWLVRVVALAQQGQPYPEACTVGRPEPAEA